MTAVLEAPPAPPDLAFEEGDEGDDVWYEITGGKAICEGGEGLTYVQRTGYYPWHDGLHCWTHLDGWDIGLSYLADDCGCSVECHPDCIYRVKFIDCTCMLERGHTGPHLFIPDSSFGVSFENSAEDV